jgi:hypothetical protein
VAERQEKHGSGGPPVADDPDPAAAAPAGEALDFDADTPTEANRANPLPAPDGEAECGTPPPELFSGPGSYRMVRPAIADHIETPAPVAADKSDKGAIGRLIIGGARKPQ